MPKVEIYEIAFPVVVFSKNGSTSLRGTTFSIGGSYFSCNPKC